MLELPGVNIVAGPALALSRTATGAKKPQEIVLGLQGPLGPFSERSLRGRGLLGGDQTHEVLLYHVAQHPVEDLLRRGPT